MRKFLSNWFVLVFLIWLYGYKFKVKGITDIINPYYTNILLIAGYIFVYTYNTRVRKYEYEPSYLLFEVSLHVLPFMISWYLVKNKFKNNSALMTLFITVIIYLRILWGGRWSLHSGYKEFKYINPLDVYLVHRHPTSWKEYTDMW